MPRLKENIISVFQTVYGLAGDVVTVISDHDNVQIVEDQSGNRFPVRTELLTYDDAPIRSVPVEKEIKTMPAKSKKGGPVTEQSTLFG